MKQKLISLLAALLALLMFFFGCAAHGKTLMEAGSNKISVNVFQLYLSRMRYSLKLAGDSVDSDGYWDKFWDTDNVTLGQLYTNQVFEGLKQIAAALILYDEKGLRLPDETEDQIDALIDQMIEEVGDGSKSQLNSVLSAYGANVTTLRDSYVIEAKIEQLKNELYGENCENITANAKEQFYQGAYYRGKQFCIFNQYQACDKDEYGQTVYYRLNPDDKKVFLTDEDGDLIISYREGDYQVGEKTVKVFRFDETDKNGDPIVVYRKLGGIAYDKDNGILSDDGKRDEAGDLIYYNGDGSIAYDTDTENKKIRATDERDSDGNTVYRHLVPAYDETDSMPNYYYEKDGSHKMATYTDEEWAKQYWLATQLARDCALAEDGEAVFDSVSAKYNQNDLNDTVAPNGMYFLIGGAVTQPIYSDIAASLSSMKTGETAVISSNLDNGVKAHYVIMRCKLDEGAWGNTQNQTWFKTFGNLLREHMLQNMVIDGGYLERVEVNEAVKGSVDISMVATNGFY